jgi:hypothetical protein
MDLVQKAEMVSNASKLRLKIIYKIIYTTKLTSVTNLNYIILQEMQSQNSPNFPAASGTPSNPFSGMGAGVVNYQISQQLTALKKSTQHCQVSRKIQKIVFIGIVSNIMATFTF